MISSLNRAPSELFTVHNIGLSIGLGASSYFFWGNMALACVGTMKLIKSGRRERFGIRPAQALQLWEASCDSERDVLFPWASVAHTIFLTAAYNAQGRSRKYLLIASVCQILIKPFTDFLMDPTTKRLKAQLRAAEARAETGSSIPEFTTALEKADALSSIERWRNLSAVRTAIAGVAWVAAVSAILVK